MILTSLFNERSVSDTGCNTRPVSRQIPRALALLLSAITAIACYAEEQAPIRPHFSPATPLSFVVDRDRVRHQGLRIPAGSTFTWNVSGARARRLRFGWSANASGPVTLRIRDHQSVTQTFEAGAPDFFDEDIPWDSTGPVKLEFSAAERADVLISDLRIVQPRDDNDAVIVVLIDTLRRDAVGLYGSKRPTTPRLDLIFAGAWRAEHAYAPASWTIPSVASLMTGMQPEVLEDDKGNPIGIPEDVPTIGYDFARAGWSTAQFNANPTLNTDNGFNRGFTAFYTPPYEVASMTLPGSDMLKRVPKWMRAHEGEKFFLYLQLIEPHEPYGPPDRPKGKTPFDPDYTGHYMGDESHYALTFDKTITPRDIEHLRALYDDDVRYADFLIGRFWDGLDAALRNRATLMLLADHGEEFFEHRGWKHGPALYNEVLSVPLMIRPGNGRRFPAVAPETLVSLTDVLPTLEHFLGIPLDRKVNGMDFTEPRARRREQLPAIHMLTGGAARAVVIRKDTKLFFFDRFGTRGIPDPASDKIGYDVALHLREVMPSLCRFDLRRDAAESQPLDPVSPSEGTDWRAIETSIAHTRRGLEIRVLGANTAQRVRFSVKVPNEGHELFAAEPDDHATAKPGGLTADLSLTPGDVDGILIRAAADAMPQITLEEGCAKLNGSALPIGSPQTLQHLKAGVPRLAFDSKCASIYIWVNSGERYFRGKQEEDEARKKLRAIGYVH